MRTSYYTSTRWPTSCNVCKRNMDTGTRAICTPSEPRKSQYAHPKCASVERLAEAEANKVADRAVLWPD